MPSGHFLAKVALLNYLQSVTADPKVKGGLPVLSGTNICIIEILEDCLNIKELSTKYRIHERF